MKARLKCPVCIEMGLKSEVRMRGKGAWRDAVIAPSDDLFWDENGVYHDHGTGARSSMYHCSQGHRFKIARYRTCSCGWRGGQDMTSVEMGGKELSLAEATELLREVFDLSKAAKG